MEIPGSFPNILSLIWTEITLGTIEYKVLEDKISIQGELRAFFVYRAEGEEEICHYETTLPFREVWNVKAAGREWCRRSAAFLKAVR